MGVASLYKQVAPLYREVISARGGAVLLYSDSACLYIKAARCRPSIPYTAWHDVQDTGALRLPALGRAGPPPRRDSAAGGAREPHRSAPRRGREVPRPRSEGDRSVRRRGRPGPQEED